MLSHQSSMYSQLLYHPCWRDFSCLISCASIIRRINELIFSQHKKEFFLSGDMGSDENVVCFNKFNWLLLVHSYSSYNNSERKIMRKDFWLVHHYSSSFLTWLGFLEYFSNQVTPKYMQYFYTQGSQHWGFENPSNTARSAGRLKNLRFCHETRM